MALEQKGDMFVQEISKEIHLNPSTVVGVLDRLEKKNYISRMRSNGDRRKVSVSITSEGKKLISDAPPLLQDVLGSALHQLPELEQVAIALSLERIVEMLEIENINGTPLLENGPAPQNPTE